MTLDNEGNFNAGISSILVKDRLTGMMHTGCNLKESKHVGWSAVPIGVRFEVKF